MMNQDRVILYDGVCNLCTGSVQFVLKRDRKEIFKFSALQSEAGRQLLAGCGGDFITLDTIVLIDEGGCHAKSGAVLRILRHLSGVWPILSLLIYLPKSFRDWVYDLVAQNRIRWFGKRETCMISLGNHSHRFLK
jgi:predicted DCC family thiol-disulfide oxidoreductase YuxK